MEFNPHKPGKRPIKLPVKPIPEAITLEDVVILGNELRDVELRALYYVLYLSAGRISEVLNMRVKDIIYAQDDVGKDIAVFSLITEKNKGHPIRNIPACYNDPKDAKKYYYEKSMIDFIKEYTSGMLGEEYIFKINRVKAWKMFTKAMSTAVRAKTPVTGKPINDYMLNIHPHYLRHVRISHLRIYYSADVISLMRVAGWSNVNQCKTYLHLGYKDLAKMFD